VLNKPPDLRNLSTSKSKQHLFEMCFFRCCLVLNKTWSQFCRTLYCVQLLYVLKTPIKLVDARSARFAVRSLFRTPVFLVSGCCDRSCQLNSRARPTCSQRVPWLRLSRRIQTEQNRHIHLHRSAGAFSRDFCLFATFVSVGQFGWLCRDCKLIPCA